MNMFRYNLLLIAWWLVRFLYDFMGLVTVPLQVIFETDNTGSSMFRYAARILRLRLYRAGRYGITFKLRREGGVLRFETLSFEERMREDEARLNAAVYPSRYEFFYRTLEAASPYQSVSFASDSHATYSVTVNVEDGTFILEIPLSPRTLNRDHAEAILSLIRKRTYTRCTYYRFAPEGTYGFREPQAAGEEREDGAETVIVIQCGASVREAANLVYDIFTRLYRRPDRPEIALGSGL